jgi:hypothetical protein
MHFRAYAQFLIAASLWAGTALAQHSSGTATPVTQNFNLPVVGLASTETAEINVVNLAPATSSGTAASCTGTIAFYNASGSAIGSATSFTTATGQISTATLPYSDTGASGRTNIRGVIALTQTPGSGVPCSLAYSVETYDSGTGVTHVHVGGGSGPGALASHGAGFGFGGR